jgi:6-phosphogluconolactonase
MLQKTNAKYNKINICSYLFYLISQLVVFFYRNYFVYMPACELCFIFVKTIKNFQYMHKNKLMLSLFAVIFFVLACCNNSNQGNRQDLSEKGASKASLPILYIGTYTEHEAHVEGKAKGIYVYEMDTATGMLHYVSTSPMVKNPSYLTVHPNRKWLYAVNETGGEDAEPTGKVSAFAITDGGKALALINSVSSEGTYPCHVSIDQSGKYVLAANYGNGVVCLLPLASDGALKNASSVDRHHGHGPTIRQESAHAHMVIPCPESRFIYATDLGTDMIYTYYLDSTAGKLMQVASGYSTRPGAGPRHIAFHPFKPVAYVVNELNGTVEAMSIDHETGRLTRFQLVSTVAGDSASDAACADIHVHPSGKYLYASNRGPVNTIAVFAIDPENGMLNLTGQQSVKGKTPRSFVIDPAGKFLLIANQDTDNVVTFRIDPADGKLVDTGIETSIPTPVCLKFLN